MNKVDSNALPAALSQVVGILDQLSSEDRLRIVETISTFYRDDFDNASMRPRTIIEERMLAPSEPIPFSSSEAYASSDAPSPKAFILDKKPRTDVERVACLAYYLQRFRGVTQFKTVDLSMMNTEAAQPKFANASSTAKNAVTQKYLVPTNKGYRQLSAAAERFVEELPDHEAAKTAMNSAGPKRRGKSNAQRRSKKSKKSPQSAKKAA